LLPTEDTEETARTIRLASILTLVVCGAGLLSILSVNKIGLWMVSLFYDQFIRIEPPAIAVIAIFAIVVYRMAGRGSPDDLEPPAWLDPSRRTQFALAAGVVAVALAGTYVVFHHYAFVDDEYSGGFQAAIYATGARDGVIPPAFCGTIEALRPTSVNIVGPCSWHLSYLPIHSMMRGAFIALHIDALAEPVTAGISIWLIFLICRRAWPDKPARATLAALMLAASTQLLLMSMTEFAMPAHLLASLVWLWVYLRPERWTIVVLPWIGVLAMGVHSPFPHVFFVAPFILRFAFQRRFAAFVYASAVYAFGVLAWTGRILTGNAAAPIVSSTAAVAVSNSTRSMLFHPAGDGVTAGMTFTLLGTWSVPIALLAALIAIISWKKLDSFTRWLALSLMFTVGMRSIFTGTQGAGWGPRYYYACLGNFSILAAIGVEMMAATFGWRRAGRLLIASLAVAMFVQLPMRGLQAEQIIRPYADASHYLESMDADIVVAYFEGVRWGRQLLRNDPFLRNRPILMGFSELKQVGLDSLKRLYPGRVRFVSDDELHKFIPKSGRVGRLRIAE
jgi:hypothetical protein